MPAERHQLTEAQLSELRTAHSQSEGANIQVRYQALLLYGLGYDRREVLEITGCSAMTLARWWRKFREGGVVAVQRKKSPGRIPHLTAEQVAETKERMHRHTPAQLFGDQADSDTGEFWTWRDVRHALQQWYGVAYKSEVSYRTVMALCNVPRRGISRRR